MPDSPNVKHPDDMEEFPSDIEPLPSLREAFTKAAEAGRFKCGHPDIPPFSYTTHEAKPDEMCGICSQIGAPSKLPAHSSAAEGEARIKTREEEKEAFRKEMEGTKPPEFYDTVAAIKAEEKAKLRNATPEEQAKADAKLRGDKPSQVKLPKTLPADTELSVNAPPFVPPKE